MVVAGLLGRSNYRVRCNGHSTQAERSISDKQRELEQTKLANAVLIAEAEAIRDGGENYLRYRQIELLPDIAPAIAQALAHAKLVTVHSGAENGDAASATTDSIASVIRTILAAQIVTRNGGLVDSGQQASARNDGERADTPVSTGARS